MDLTHSVPAARSSSRLAGWIAVVVALAALNYAGRYLADAPLDRDALYRWSTVVATVFQFGILLGLTLLIVRGAAADLLALRRPRSWQAATGIMLVVFVGVFVLSGLVSLVGDPSEEQGLTPEGWRPDQATPFAANFVMVATFVPAVEELLYRGAGFSLLSRFGPAAAILGTGLAFGFGHGVLLGLPIFIAFGLGLAWLRERSDSVYPCIVLHGAFNGISLIASVTLA